MSNFKATYKHKTIFLKIFNVRFALSFNACDWNIFKHINYVTYKGISASNKNKFTGIMLLGFGCSIQRKNISK